MTEYKITPIRVTDKEAFVEASVEELRVLVALIECNGCPKSTDALAKAAHVSKTRAASAIVFWQEAEVIKPLGDTPTITEEFEDRLRKGEITEESAEEIARSIRNEGLADLISECAAIMNRSALNSTEIKNLCALATQYALEEEYIITLATYMAKNAKKLTVTKLTNKAINLVEKDIDTVDKLEAYIADNENTSEAEKAFRSIFGLWNGALSSFEKECFLRWSRKYGYFTNVVEYAYTIACEKGVQAKVKYVDRLIRAWYEAGCRTVAECKSKYERDLEARKEKKKEQKKNSTKKKPDDTYGAFGDPDEELKKALARSFGAFSFDDEENK